jgi:hypothetical protein
MRVLVLLLAFTTACGKTKSASGEGPSGEGSGGSAAAAPVEAVAPAPPSPSPSALALDHITLLEPNEILEARLSDADGLTAAMKQATAAITAYDTQHPGALPAELDLVIAARANAIHAWAVGASGDISAPGLDAALAKLPVVPVKSGVVGAVATLVRPGTQPAKRGPYLPASWKAAAGAGGASVDDVIEKAWPR